MCGYVTLSSRPFQLLVLFFRPSPRLRFDQNNQHEQISVSLSWLYFVEKLNFDGYKTLSRRHSGSIILSLRSILVLFLRFGKYLSCLTKQFYLPTAITHCSVYVRNKVLCLGYDFFTNRASRHRVTAFLVHFSTAKTGLLHDFCPFSIVQFFSSLLTFIIGKFIANGILLQTLYKSLTETIVSLVQVSNNLRLIVPFNSHNFIVDDPIHGIIISFTLATSTTFRAESV